MNLFIAIATLGLLGFLFYVWNNRSTERRPEEIKEILQLCLDGELDSGEWDYFLTCRIKNKELEKIRKRCQQIWMVDSEYLVSDSINPSILSEKGRNEVAKLIRQCDQIEDQW